MIELPREIAEGIVAHAKFELPLEACGILAGRGAAPLHLYPMRNAEGSSRRFRFDTREQRRVFSEIESRGWGVSAFFHSHPRTAAFPSPGDAAAAHRRNTATGRTVATHPEAHHIIVSLRGDAPELRGFRFVEGRTVEEPVRIL